MNFIFDVGNVLLEFSPESFLGGLFSDTELVNTMNRVIFKSEEWEKLDQGVLTHAQATDIFCAREPNFETAIHLTMQNLKSMMPPMPETITLLPKVKAAGHKLYYLSNYHKEIRDYVVREHSFWELFDGGVFSCDIHVTKPSPRIYHHLLDTYNLTPGDCVFFDDVEENVAAACDVGIHGVLFTGAECVKAFISAGE